MVQKIPALLNSPLSNVTNSLTYMGIVSHTKTLITLLMLRCFSDLHVFVCTALHDLYLHLKVIAITC